MQQRIDTLLMVEEEREEARRIFASHQQIVKKWFDEHKAGGNNFEVGELVLKWDKINDPKGKHSKFQNMWLGPFEIVEKIGIGTYHFQNLRGELESLPIS
jgi:hypothetical protein